MRELEVISNKHTKIGLPDNYKGIFDMATGTGKTLTSLKLSL